MIYLQEKCPDTVSTLVLHSHMQFDKDNNISQDTGGTRGLPTESMPMESLAWRSILCLSSEAVSSTEVLTRYKGSLIGIFPGNPGSLM